MEQNLSNKRGMKLTFTSKVQKGRTQHSVTVTIEQNIFPTFKVTVMEERT